MKIFSLIVFFLLFIAAGYAQEYNKTIIDEEENKPMLIGLVNRDAFNDSTFGEWFKPAYEGYTPDDSVLTALNGRLNNTYITIVLGSWCSDSHIYIPALFKILDKLSYPMEKITMIGVNRNKVVSSESPSSKEDISPLNINFVPTIIFSTDAGELGRIVEMPNETVEKDMLSIINGK